MADTKQSGFEESLAKQVAAFRDVAVKSSDPLVVGKAVAASDQGVQQLILARLDAGERLAEVFAFQPPTGHDVQVFFRFDPREESIRLVDSGVLAFVDSARGEVSGTIDPYTLHPERRMGRPFVSIEALQASADAFAASEHTLEALVARERAFFRSVGLGRLARGGLGVSTDTVCDTGTTSTTWSGQPYRPDQTDPETTGDYCDSQGPILA